MPNCGPNTQINLQRNTEVFWSTIDLNGGGVSASMTPDNTWRVEVLAGYAFNQSATNQDINTLESGNTPDRATQRFNTSVNPVEWSMSTYSRPSLANTKNTGVEEVLWAMFAGADTYDSSGAVFKNGASALSTNDATSHIFNFSQNVHIHHYS